MDVLINVYNNCKTVFQGYGASFSGIYVTVMLLLLVWATHEKKEWNRLFQYSCWIFFAIIAVCVFTVFYPIDGVNGCADIYMVLPTTLMIILICVYLGVKFEVKKKYIIMVFTFLIMCEASVPMRISVTNSFTYPNRYGKNSSVAEQVYELVGDESVELPASLENEFRVLKWDGTLTEETIYDDGESYLINVSYSEVINQAIQNDKEYIVIRYTDMLGNTNIETIQSVLETKGYESVDVVGKYVVAKKSK